MPITIQGYKSQRDLGGNISAPGVRPSVTNSGLGEAITQLGTVGEKVYDRVTRENAETESLAATAKVNSVLEKAYIDDQTAAQPGAPEFTPTFMKKVDDAINTTAQTLTNDAARKRFRERTLAMSMGFEDRSLKWESSERIAKRGRDFATSADDNANSVYTVDGANRELTYRGLYDDMNASLDAIGLPPSTREQLREEAKNKMSYAAVQGDLRDRPDKVQDWLVARDGAKDGGSYYSALRASESGGRNVGASTSSAFGPYQFIRGTWKNLIEAHPDLGLTEADRFNPAKQEIAIRAFTADNAKALQKAGIEPSNLNLKMAHLLGSGGATEFIRAFKANPNDDARAHVSPATTAANAGIFKPGRTVGEVMQLFGKQFGTDVSYDKGSGTPAYYADIPFAKRDALYSAAETELNKRRTQSLAGFNQRVQNSLGEFAASGVATSPPSEQEFVAAMGPNNGAVAYGEFQARSAGATAGFQMLRMTASEIPQFVEAQRPKAGDPFFAEKQQAFAQVSQVAVQLAEERRNDPAGLVARQNPAADVALRDALNPNTADSPAKLEAWVSLARTSGSERVLPNSIRDAMNRSFSRVPVDNVEASAMRAEFDRQKTLWGSEWPGVLRELGDQNSDIRVIGAVSEEAATMLLANRKASVGELVKVLPAGSSTAIDGELQGKLADYAKSLRLPGEDGTAFFAAGQKLAALKMRDGLSASSAADWAYQELIGKRYAFEGDTRLPKDMEPLANSLDAAKGDALKDADLSALPPGVSVEDAKSWYASSARWVTLPDDRGVVLMSGQRAVRDARGNVIARDWARLHDFAAKQPSADESFLEMIKRQGDPGSNPNQAEEVKAQTSNPLEGKDLNIVERGALLGLRAMQAAGVGGTKVKLYNEFVQDGRTSPVTENDLSSDDISGLKSVIKNHMEYVNSNPDSFKGAQKNAIQLHSYQMAGKANLHNLLGAFTFTKNDKGEVIIKDVYDFNDIDERTLSTYDTAKQMFKDPEKVAGAIGFKAIPEGKGKGIPIRINLGKID